MAMHHSDAGMATLLADGGYLISGHQPLNLTCDGHLAAGEIIKVYEPDTTGPQDCSTEPTGRALKRFVTPCPEEECDAARAQLEPYVLSQFCRIELLADMKRTATDCRSNFGGAADPVAAIFQALREICPDATAAELRTVLTAAEAELHVKVARLGGWKSPVLGVTPEIETWLELAKGRIHDLSWARTNVK
jgi:hypothetical protein